MDGGGFETSSSVHQVLEVKPVHCRAAVICCAGSRWSMRLTDAERELAQQVVRHRSDPGSSWMSRTGPCESAALASGLHARVLSQRIAGRPRRPSPSPHEAGSQTSTLPGRGFGTKWVKSLA
jgi:hypothetical protein